METLALGETQLALVEIESTNDSQKSKYRGPKMITAPTPFTALPELKIHLNLE